MTASRLHADLRAHGWRLDEIEQRPVPLLELEYDALQFNAYVKSYNKTKAEIDSALAGLGRQQRSALRQKRGGGSDSTASDIRRLSKERSELMSEYQHRSERFFLGYDEAERRRLLREQQGGRRG